MGSLYEAAIKDIGGKAYVDTELSASRVEAILNKLFGDCICVVKGTKQQGNYLWLKRYCWSCITKTTLWKFQKRQKVETHVMQYDTRIRISQITRKYHPRDNSKWHSYNSIIGWEVFTVSCCWLRYLKLEVTCKETMHTFYCRWSNVCNVTWSQNFKQTSETWISNEESHRKFAGNPNVESLWSLY